jgi:hypothetical protein
MRPLVGLSKETFETSLYNNCAATSNGVYTPEHSTTAVPSSSFHLGKLRDFNLTSTE